ncbi:hypothetical protein [Gemmata sp.]|uniref:hypothetical protein n=1 Tax=Gemmata sp. TaxID=1914242 RepID=UPI003F6F91E2
MRSLSCRVPGSCLLAAAVWLAVAAAAQEPGPLLKPVVPPSSGTRVRVATSEEDPVFYHFAARVPDPKNKDKSFDCTVAFDSLPSKAMVAAKKWKEWGFEVPANRTATLPELVVRGVQVAPRTTRGRDVEVRLVNLKVEIIEPPKDGDKVLLSDLLLPVNELTKGADKAFEPRMYFGDKFLEFTVSTGVVKKLGTGDDGPLPEPAVSPDKDLLPFAGPTVSYQGTPAFAFASVDGQQKYKLPDGKTETVNVGLSSTMNWPEGVLMTLGTARGLGLTVEDAKDLKGLGAGFDATVARAKVKEVRLAVLTGSGLKVPKDLVLKDLTVIVDKSNSQHFVWIGTRFLDANVTDAVYGCDSYGTWRLSGRVKPELLMDPKTRTPPPPLKKP